MPDLSDRDALVAIYEYTRGSDRWRTNTYWCSEQRCGKWFGVTVDAGAHVLSIILTDNRLDGFFFENPRFSPLVNLRTLALGSNLLRGNIPHSFKYFVSLEELDLSWNKFEGEIPEEIFSLVHMRMLKLDNNSLTGGISQALGHLTKLAFLQLHNNDLSGPIPKVGDKLSRLNVCEFRPGNNKLEGPVPPDAIEMRKHWEPVKIKRRVQLEDDRPGSGSGSRPGSRSGSRDGRRPPARDRR
jgi:Leucine rich repeat